MKSCSRCGRNLEKTGHSLSCSLGQFIKKVDEGGADERIRIAFPNDELKHQFGEMMARTAQAMVAVKTFYDACTEIDETDPEFMSELGPALEKFVVDLCLIYPNSVLFDQDLNTLLGKKKLIEFYGRSKRRKTNWK
jgi:hypothetical protein